MRPSRHPVLWFLVLTYALTLVGQGVHLYVMQRLSARSAGMPIKDSPVRAWMPYAFYLTNVGPSVVGLLLTGYLYGLPGVRWLVGQLAPWSVGRTWPVLAISLFLPLAIVLLAYWLLAALGRSDPPGSWRLSEYLYGAIVSHGLLGAGLCEELGWRGFALPHLQRRHSALVSSLLVGVAWAVWHWPNFVLSSDPGRWWQFAALAPVSMIVCVLYTWTFNSTGGSLFAVVALHGATVAVSNVAPASGDAVGLLGQLMIPLLFLLVAVGLVWRYGAENLSRRARVEAGETLSKRE